MRVRDGLLAALLLAAVAAGGVRGTVVNGSTGSLVAGALVELRAAGQTASPLEAVRADARGRFEFARAASGPAVVSASFEGVPYLRLVGLEQALAPVTLVVYRVSKTKDPARIRSHMVRFEPAGGRLQVVESFTYGNEGAATWNDPAAQPLVFYLPPGARANARVTMTPEGGVPVEVAMTPSRDAGHFGVSFPVRPGETAIDVKYEVPYSEGSVFHGESPGGTGARLSAAAGFVLRGPAIHGPGPEYSIADQSYDVTVETSRQNATTSATAASDSGADDGSAGFTVERSQPRLYAHLPVLLGLMLAALALGFLRLYRRTESRVTRY